MYRRPAQCSPLLRAKIDAGWATRRSSATEGVGVRTDTRPRLPLVHREMLQHGVAVGSRRRRVEHGGHELVLAEAEVLGRARQAMTREAGVDLLRDLLVLAEERGEEGAGSGQLAVARRARVEVVDRVHDL